MHCENVPLFDIVEEIERHARRSSRIWTQAAPGSIKMSDKRSSACAARKPKRIRDQPARRTAGWVARPTQLLSALTTLGRDFS
jgi:hypothetical protein